MSKETTIQWASSTVNAIMGCFGCELFPTPQTVLGQINKAVSSLGITIDSRAIYKVLIEEAFAKLNDPQPGHTQAVNTTNIWHLKEMFEAKIRSDYGEHAAKTARLEIELALTCYAAKQHLNRGKNILEPKRQVNAGYAPIFERPTHFPGRVAAASKYSDLFGKEDPKSPWKNGLPRMIFISDMGDAFSTPRDFEYLKSDTIPPICSEDGKRHLWLWLTKRPDTMAQFSQEIEGFPPNVCAMTTVTSADTEVLKRVDALRNVKASIKGLSIEPLWEQLPPEKLNLEGIDWVIVGGESGSGLNRTRPFAVEWAEVLREHCRNHGVAFFLKQLGRNPMRNGEVFKLKDPHGGDWNEWDEALRIREFPQAFYEYRKNLDSGTVVAES